MVVFGQGAASLSYRSTERLSINPSCLHITFGRSQIIGVPGAQEPSTPLKITGTNDIAVRRGFLDATETLPALFVGLNTENNGIDLHDAYLGPCDRRPVSLNCVGNQPIRTIGAVPADCCNTIYIELQGVTITPLDNYCGIAVDTDFTLEASCPPRELVGVVKKLSEDCDVPSDDYLSEQGSDGGDSGTTGTLPPELPPGPSTGEEPGESNPLGSLTPSLDVAPEERQVLDVYDMAMLYDSFDSVYGDAKRFDTF